MFGRRVFFLNPPLSVENTVLPFLKDLDYEVYVIREYACAKPILKLNENAICFIFIDDELTFDGWFNFIKSFETDDSVKSIFLGVLSLKAKPKDQEHFMMNLKLPGGFVMLEKNMEVSAETIEGILRINGAKGVRKCIRLELKDNNEVNGYFTNGSMLYSFKLVDISSLGFAAVVPAKMGGIFQKGRVIPNVSITMKRYSFVCSIVVFNAKVTGDTCLVVMMLHPETSKVVRKKIHDFVYESLELRHRLVVETIPRDFTDYSVRLKDPSEKDDEAVEDAEELSEEVNESKQPESTEENIDAENKEENKPEETSDTKSDTDNAASEVENS